jgi:hypothetical protein
MLRPGVRPCITSSRPPSGSNPTDMCESARIRSRMQTYQYLYDLTATGNRRFAGHPLRMRVLEQPTSGSHFQRVTCSR